MKVSLKIKILIFALSIILLLGSATGYFFLRRISNLIEEQIVYRLNVLSSNISLNAEDPIILEDDTYMAQLVKDIMSNRGFVYAKILDTDYKILASNELNEWGSVDSSIIFIDKSVIKKNKDVIELLKPVYLGDEKIIGFVRIASSTNEIVEAQKSAFVIIAFVTGIFFLIGIILSIVFSSLLTKQLNFLMIGLNKVSKGDLNVQVKRISNDELGVLTETFNTMVTNIREKELIKIAFTRYVSKQVAEKVFENPDTFLNKLKGERKEVSILFADIVGFTSMSEKLLPEEVVKILNTYLSSMVSAVFKHNGTLDKFIGDCVMAVFGAPIVLENSSLSAVNCAIEIQREVSALNLERKSMGLSDINIGIGINTGIAVVGNIGSKERLDYTVIGDNVNLASRLQSTANALKVPIIVSLEVIKKIEGKIDYRQLESVQLKGISSPVKIFSILLR